MPPPSVDLSYRVSWISSCRPLLSCNVFVPSLAPWIVVSDARPFFPLAISFAFCLRFEFLAPVGIFQRPERTLWEWRRRGSAIYTWPSSQSRRSATMVSGLPFVVINVFLLFQQFCSIVDVVSDSLPFSSRDLEVIIVNWLDASCRVEIS